MRRCALLSLFAGAVLAPAAPCHAQRQEVSPPTMPGGKPLEVVVGMYVQQLNSIDEAAQTASVEGWVELRWHDRRQAFDGDSAGTVFREWGGEAAGQQLGRTVWWPDPILLEVEQGGTLDRYYLRIDTAGRINFSARFNATVLTPLELRRFPYDRQAIRITVEQYAAGVGTVRFVPDTSISGVGQRVALAEWNVSGFRALADVDDYTHMGELWDAYSRYIFELGVARRFGFYNWKVLLPLLMIVASGWTVFWFRDLATQLSVAFTVMLTVVAFTFVIADTLPRVPYLTFLDILLLTGYTFVFLSLLVVVAAHVMERQ
ncbi:MAG TPA: hypothetical protein VGX50_19140, partial [Longimicrobium sp.]|nr:hypothetical protein [Longimicrobium sp.]